jgi:pre-mycofactocin synthase
VVRTGFNPRVGGAIAPERDLRAEFMGQPLSMPLVMSPAGAQAIHSEGELPVARATRKADLAMGHSNFASSPFEEIAAENPKSFYQLYWSGDRDSILRRVEKGREAGSKGLIITLDATFSQPKDWYSPPVPTEFNITTMLKFAPDGLARPRYLLEHLRHGDYPT